MNTRYNQGGGTHLFLMTSVLSDNGRTTPCSFLITDQDSFVTKTSVSLTKKRPQALPAGGRPSVDADLGWMWLLTKRLSFRITSPQRGVCRLAVCTGCWGLIAVIAAPLGSSTATTLGSQFRCARSRSGVGDCGIRRRLLSLQALSDTICR